MMMEHFSPPAELRPLQWPGALYGQHDLARIAHILQQ